MNRAPIKGTISYLHYNPGKFISAFKEKASLDNEQVSIGFIGHDNGKDGKVLVKIIAGFIARRIVVWRDRGEELSRGERMSLIKFGSRADVFLPAGTEVSVKPGDTVKGGGDGDCSNQVTGVRCQVPGIVDRPGLAYISPLTAHSSPV